jgi:hypothetical protein
VLVNSYNAHDGVYHARFFTSGSYSSRENAYLSKNVGESDVYARGYFRFVAGGSRVLMDEDDRLYLIRFSDGSGFVAWAGVRREGGVNKWTLYASGARTSSVFSVSFDRWYCVELHWNSVLRVAELFVDGVLVLDVDLSGSGGSVGRVDMGVIYTYSVQDGVIVYGDDFAISRNYIGVE